ncbi:MAG: methylmalonyl-CoA mutase family protein [Opitutaceae bacterium]|jgi:methylmalonyl-CoA mutase|nr:methylmalonyl-CoA mutase family protein [Opitutaceae bacterium]
MSTPAPAKAITYTDWRAQVEKDILAKNPKGSFEKSYVAKTSEGIAVQPLYTDADVAGLDAAASFIRASRLPKGGWQWTPLDKPETCPCEDPASDPVAALLLTGSLEKTFAANFDELAARVKNNPGARQAAVTACIYHEAAANAVQELAFALATAVAYTRELAARGIPAETALNAIRTEFAVGVDFFMEVSKLRAYRLLWANVAAAFNASAKTAFIGARTALWDKTVLDHHVNLLRLTTEAMSAVVGGCDTLLIRPFDGVGQEPTELGKRMSKNLHDLLADEFSLAQAMDPAGGSYYVEKLTDELARNAWKLFQDIEAKGGMIAAVKSGYVQSLVAAAAKEKQKLVDSRRRVFLGTTLQPNLKDKPPQTAPKPPCAAAGQAAAETAEKLVRRRGAEDFETVRAAGDAFAAKNNGQRATVFLARMGPPKQHKARADFSTGFMSIGGFEIAKGASGFASADEAAQAAANSGAPIAILCSTDDTYPELVPAFAKKLKELSPKTAILVAGAPGENEAAWRAAGVNEFINIRSNVRTTLAQLQKLAGVIA